MLCAHLILSLRSVVQEGKEGRGEEREEEEEKGGRGREEERKNGGRKMEKAVCAREQGEFVAGSYPNEIDRIHVEN